MTRERMIEILLSSKGVADINPDGLLARAIIRVVNEALDEAANESRVTIRNMLDIHNFEFHRCMKNIEKYEVDKESILKLKVK